MQLPKIVYKIASYLHKKGLKPILVGGAVRDFYLQNVTKDFDIEVYNLVNYDELVSVLSKFGSVNSVGKSFGVVKLKIDNLEIDFSMPRLESKVDKGHKGFIVDVKKSLSFKEAAKRRDFTINAIGWDIVEQKIIDPFNGLNDLKNKTLQIVDKQSFIEDPLRVYRAIQFAARFEFKLSSESFALCKEMVDNGSLEELPKERVWEEFKKLLLKAKKPSIGFKLMRELGILKYFPELQALIGIEQEPTYHSEGDVWTHTLMVVEEMAKLRGDDEFLNLKLMLAALCHDFGKPYTTKVIDGKIRALGHEEAGIEPTITFLHRLTNHKELIESVSKLVKYHLRVMQLYKSKAKNGAIKRLATKIDIKTLEKLSRADYFGRGGVKEQNFKAGEWILKKARELNVLNSPIKPLINGKDLINLGLTPSKQFKEILNHIYQKQLDEEIKTKEEALELVKKYLNNKR